MAIRTVFIGVLVILSGCIQPVEAPTLPLSSIPVFAPEIKLPEYEGQGELEGHTWQVGDVTFSFQHGNHLLVRGGHLDETMPTGAPGRYSLKEGELELEVLGREYTGQWKDNNLSISENTGVYLGPSEGLFTDTTEIPQETDNEVIGENNDR